MSDYAKFSVNFVYSAQSDYGRPSNKREVDLELTPDEMMHRRLDVANTGTNLWTVAVPSQFATITGVLIRNLDTAIAMQVDWTSSTAATACAVSIAAGGWNFITDVDGTAVFTLTAASSTINAEVFVTGT